MQNYQTFKNEYLNLCTRFGRDTKRKIKNDLNNDVKELEYQIEHLAPRLNIKVYTYLYGRIHNRQDLCRIKTELEYTKQLLTEI